MTAEIGAAIVRAAVYCRISRAVDAKGVNRQLEDALAIAREKGWTVRDESIYIDNDVGASEFTKKARKEYMRMLSDIEEGKYDAVILWLEDRGHRRVIDAWKFVQLCKEHNVFVFITSEGRDYDFSDPLDEAEFYGSVAKAQRETALVSRRLRRQRQQVAEAGEPHPGGMRHYGFQGYKTRQVPEEQLRQERANIHEAVTRIIAGDSVRGITREWNKHGVRTATGGIWRSTSLRRILTSPALVGLRKHNGSHYPAAWDPIISREEWDEVRAILLDPSRRPKGGRGPAYLLTGLIYCGVCGHRMRAYGKEGDRYYRCENWGPDAKLPRVVRRVKFADAEVTARLLYRLTSPQVQDAAEAEYGETDSIGEQISRIMSELARYQGLLDRLEDKIADELISRPTGKRKRTEYEREMEKLRARYTELTGTRIVSHLPSNIAEVWDDLSLDRRRAILATAIERVVIHPCGPIGYADPNSIQVLWRDRPMRVAPPEQ